MTDVDTDRMSRNVIGDKPPVSKKMKLNKYTFPLFKSRETEKESRVQIR